MASTPTIAEILDIAPICQYLAYNDIERNDYANGGTLDPLLPVKIYMARKAVQWGVDQNYIARSATAVFYINGTGNVGDVIEVVVDDPDDGLITIGTYTLDSGDTDNEIIAANVAASITGSGYSATSNGIAVIVTAPFGLGNLMNGLDLTLRYIKANPFDFTFDYTFG